VFSTSRASGYWGALPSDITLGAQHDLFLYGEPGNDGRPQIGDPVSSATIAGSRHAATISIISSVSSARGTKRELHRWLPASSEVLFSDCRALVELVPSRTATFHTRKP